MKKLRQLLLSDATLPLRTIKALSSYTLKRPLNLYPDPNLIKHDKHVDKEYLIEETLDLHDEYPFILKAKLMDYGYANGDNLTSDFNDFRGVSYYLSSLDQRRSRVHLRGVLTGSYAEMDMDIFGNINIRAIESDDYAQLVLHESLAIEAYLLERETNHKLAFFMYFSATESIVRDIIEDLKQGATPEEAQKMEHSSLSEKAKIAGKHIFEIDDLKLLPVWGAFMSLLKSCALQRNKIAHATKTQMITPDDVNTAAVLYVITEHILIRKTSSLPAIINVYKTPGKAKG